MSTDRLQTPHELGVANRSRLIRLLHRRGPQSRSDLARYLGVSRATITTIVQPLLDSRVLEEAAPTAPLTRAGRPSRPLWFSPMLRTGCVHVDAERIDLAVLAMDGAIERRATHALVTAGPETTNHILERCREFFEADHLLGIGVAAAGMVDTDAGRIIRMYRRDDLTGFAIAPRLEEALGVPVTVDHHPRVQAIGDLWFGDGRELRTFASLYTGDVLGVGLVLDDQVQRGAAGAGGEIGHLTVDMHGARCICGRTGCWETVATVPWLRARAAEMGLPGAEAITGASLVALTGGTATGAREAADRLLREYVHNVAIGLASLEQLLGLGTYIVHGDLASAGEDALGLLAHELATLAPLRGTPPRLSGAPAEDIATLRGAAGLALEERLRTLGTR